MPNWVQNFVYFDREDVSDILNAVKYDDEVLGSCDFEKIIPMPKSLEIEANSDIGKAVNVYLTFVNPKTKDYGVAKKSEADFKTITLAFSDIGTDILKPNLSDAEISVITKYVPVSEVIKLGETVVTNFINYGAFTWYEWSITNWGTKWNSSNSFESTSYLNFQTAWDSPTPIIKKMSEMFPNVTMTLTYADEDLGNNCGKLVYKNGEVISSHFPKGNEAYLFACEVWDYDPEAEEILLEYVPAGE